MIKLLRIAAVKRCIEPCSQYDGRAVWMNSAVTLDMLQDIERVVGIDLCYTQLSWNRNVTVDFVVRHKDEPWAWMWLGSTWGALNGGLRTHSLDVQEMLITKRIPWDWQHFEFSPDMKESVLDIVLAHPSLPWSNMSQVCAHPSVTLSDVDLLRQRLFPDNDAVFWEAFSLNPNVTMDFIRGNLDMPWNWSLLSRNKGIKIEEILQSRGELPWDFHSGVSRNPNLIFSQHVLSQPEIAWDTLAITAHRNTTLADIEGNPAFAWCSVGLCHNPNLTMDFIERHWSNFQWHWDIVSRADNRVTYSDIMRTRGAIPWKQAIVLARPSLLHVDTCTPDPDVLQAARRHVAARRIQRAFRQAMGNPSYTMCRRRLMWEFEEELKVIIVERVIV